MNLNVYLCVAVMAAVTYFIRALPLVLIRKKIENRFFASFLYYVPFVTLSVMVFPDILSSTSNTVSAVIGFAVAIVTAFAGGSLPIVSLFAVASVFITEFFTK
ncbi:MAG: AzlD domain-containing protein [Clostridia bacterium]|nr:AzlD domain-containing protein [Clostridia bacterium]